MMIQEGVSVFDLCLQIEGSLENIIDFMEKYNIPSLDFDLTGFIITPEYNLNSDFVADLLLRNVNLSTKEEMTGEFLGFDYAEFNKAFSNDFDSLQK